MNWDYKALGFTSEEEMQDSIARCKQAMIKPVNEVADGIDNMNRLREKVDEHGRLNINAIAEGARLEGLDKVVMSRLFDEERQAREQKRIDAINDLLKKAGDSSKAERDAKAQRAIDDEKAKALKSIEDKHRKENNVFVDPLDDAYRKLLNGE